MSKNISEKINESKVVQNDVVREPVVVQNEKKVVQNDVVREPVVVQNEEPVIEKKVEHGTVNCYLLNVRKLPDPKSLVVSVLSKDEEVVIIDDSKSGWYKISIASEYKGHVMSKFIDKK